MNHDQNRRVSSPPELHDSSRRGFLRTLVRGAIGTGLVAAGGYLAREEEPDSACKIEFACDRCSQLRKCILPEATAYKVRNLQKQKEQPTREKPGSEV